MTYNNSIHVIQYCYPTFVYQNNQYLLLMRASAPIGIPQGIHVIVAVQPASSAVSMSQGDLRAVGNLDWLAFRDARQASFEARLEGASHHGIVGSGFREHHQVCVKHDQVHAHDGSDYHQHSREQVKVKNDAGQVLLWDQRPIVPAD